MKTKHIILIISLLLILFNSLCGAILEGYKMSTCLLVDLSIFISMGLLYYLFASRLSDGYKIGAAVILLFSGVARTICMGIMGAETQNNVALLIAIAIFLIEISLIIVVSYMSKK